MNIQNFDVVTWKDAVKSGYVLLYQSPIDRQSSAPQLVTVMQRMDHFERNMIEIRLPNNRCKLIVSLNSRRFVPLFFTKSPVLGFVHGRQFGRIVN